MDEGSTLARRNDTVHVLVAVAATFLSALVALSSISRAVAAQGGPPTRGNYSAIIISLKTAEGTASQCSNASLNASYFTDARSVAAYYAENSFGSMTMSGVVTGPHVVSLAEGWTRNSVANEADAAAAAAGVDLSLFSLKVYVLPKEADPKPIQSAWGGWGGRPRLWIRDYWCSSRWLAAHELGHFFGVGHASTPADDYGDFSTPMGGRIDPGSDPLTWNVLPHFNAPGKIAAGWLPESAVQTVTANGSFRVASLETLPAPGQLQALRIKGANDGADHYYLSFRQAAGFSSVLTPQYVATTSITRWNGATGSKTCLLANLADGQAFVDKSGLMVAQRSHDATHADITVTFGAAVITDANVTCP